MRCSCSAKNALTSSIQSRRRAGAVGIADGAKGNGGKVHCERVVYRSPQQKHMDMHVTDVSRRGEFCGSKS
jgi:hypothetical protein